MQQLTVSQLSEQETLKAKLRELYFLMQDLQILESKCDDIAYDLVKQLSSKYRQNSMFSVGEDVVCTVLPPNQQAISASRKNIVFHELALTEDEPF